MELTTDQTARAAASNPQSDASPPGETQWWSYPVAEVLTRLKADRTVGLSDSDAATRLQQVGPNSLPEEEQESVWASLIEAFKDPLAIVLTVAAALSAIIGLTSGDTQELKQAALIMGIVIFMTLIGYFTDRSAGNELAKLKDLQ
jgi:Ca2+-transporting ATPase